MQREIRLVAALVVLAIAGITHAEAPARVEGTGWVVQATVQHDALAVELKARGAFHLNDDYPIRFDVTPDAHVEYEQKRVEKKEMQFVTCKDPLHRCAATTYVPFQASGAGHVGGTLAFAACDADRCVIEKIAVSVPVAGKK
jgi:hypothetical protein